MDLYKVLLVDDEEEVRHSIVKKLAWEQLGFTVAGEASNGEEALELAELLQPDVIMTDIKMPFMDGLELCRRAKAMLPGVRVAIFSGFDEFEYAREAITQQVEEYILKPIDADQLAQVFLRLRESLEVEIAQRRDMEELRRRYEQSLPLMRQQLLMEWLNDFTEPDPAVFQEHGMDIGAENYCVAVVCADQEAEAQEGNHRLLPFSLAQLISDTIQDLHFHKVQTSDGLVLIFLLQPGQGTKQITAQLGQLFPVSLKMLGVRLSIGVGGVYAQPSQLSPSYREACRALDYQILVEPGQPVVIGDMEPALSETPASDSQLLADLVRQIKVGSEEELRQVIGALTRNFKQRKIGIQEYEVTLLELTTELLKIIRTYQLDPEDARLDELLAGGQLLRFSNVEDLTGWLLDYCENLRALVRRERKDSARLLIDRAKDILQRSFADSELTQDMVCSQLNVSPAYFSSLFKKETGQGFVGYLTGLRMEAALDLLSTSDEKTYQIAEKVGYTDPNYFSYVFKKAYGVSPSKYKRDAKNQP